MKGIWRGSQFRFFCASQGCSALGFHFVFGVGYTSPIIIALGNFTDPPLIEVANFDINESHSFL